MNRLPSKIASPALTGNQLPGNQLASNQLTRRTALKLLAGSVAGVALPSTALLAAQPIHRCDASFAVASLTVEIVTGESTPEDTVLLSTIANSPVSLQRFMPGTLAFGDRTLDLNRVLLSGELKLVPGAVQSVLLPAVPRQPDSALREYLLVDSAVEMLGAIPGATHDTRAQIITLHAMVDAEGTAAVYLPSSADTVEMG